jgi:hypothetical protein
VKRGSLAGSINTGSSFGDPQWPWLGLSRPAAARSGGGAAVKCARQPGRAAGRVRQPRRRRQTGRKRNAGRLARLPLRQCQIVVLRPYLDLDTCSTPEVLCIAPGTVRADMARAIAALRDEFTPLNEELHQ